MSYNLNSLVPLDPTDPDFPVAVAAMRNARATASLNGHPNDFWLIDDSAADPTGMVSVVDLTSLGQIAVDMGPDWGEHSHNVRIYPMGDQYAIRDVLEYLVHKIRAIRFAKEQASHSPSP